LYTETPMSVKASKSKKPVAKKASAKKATAKKKLSTKKPVKKPVKKAVAKKTTAKKAVSKKTVGKKSPAKKSVAKKSSSKKPAGLPGLKLAQVYQVVQAETKKLLAPLTKKASQLKQHHANAQKKLKTEQDNLNKLEQKHTEKPGKALAKQVASAKNKVKLAASNHDKALNASHSATSEHAKMQNHLDKMMHLEKNFKQLNTTWDQQHSHVGKPVAAPKAANTNAGSSMNKNMQNNVVGSSNKPNPAAQNKQQSNQSNQANKNNQANKTKVNLNLEKDNAWTKFDQNKDHSVFAKIDKLADYDSDKDADDNDKWRKFEK